MEDAPDFNARAQGTGRTTPRDGKYCCHLSSQSTTATMLPEMLMKQMLKCYGSQSKSKKQIRGDGLLENIW